VKVPEVSALATATLPVPSVTAGPLAKNTRLPIAVGVVPSAVPMGCGIRFCSVTSARRVCRLSR